MIELARSQPPFALSIDIGTSSMKTAVFDIQGRVVKGSIFHEPVDLITSADGTAVVEADPLLESVWWCIDRSLESIRMEGYKLTAVGCSTFVSNIMGVNQDDQAVTPIYTYADTRPYEDVKLLRDRYDEAAVHQRTGCLFHPSYLPARFLWLKRTQPKLLASDMRWMSVGEYMYLKLFGITAVSHSVASWSGLLDWRHLAWDRELLASIYLNAGSLSTLVDIDQPILGMQSPFSSRWSALKNIPWFPAVGDGAAANVGSGCYQPDRVTLTMGSTTAMRVVLPDNLNSIPTGLWNYRLDREHTLLGGALSEGGNIFTWLMKTLRFDENTDLEALLKTAPADHHGLTFLPLLAGERSPGWRGEARGALVGLSLASTPEDLFVAAHEGIAYRIREIYSLLCPHLNAEHLIVTNGGALVNSPAWVQIIADVLGQTINLSDVQEASARGAAMLALKNCGAVSKLSDFPDFIGRQYIPDSDKHSIYTAAMHRQAHLYRTLY